MNAPPLQDEHLKELERQKQPHQQPLSIMAKISLLSIYQKIAYVGIAVLAIGIMMVFMFELLVQNYTCQKLCGDQYTYKNSFGQCCLNADSFDCVDSDSCTSYSKGLLNFGIVFIVLGILMILFKLPKVSGFFKGIIQKFSIKKPKKQNEQYQRAPN